MISFLNPSKGRLFGGKVNPDSLHPKYIELKTLSPLDP